MCSSRVGTPTPSSTLQDYGFQTPIPRATATYAPTATPIVLTEFPDWVNDETASVLLLPVASLDGEFLGLHLFNAESGEEFSLPFPYLSAYFWRSAHEVGLATKNQFITLINTQNNSFVRLAATEEVYKFAVLEDDEIPIPHIAIASSTSSVGFVIVHSQEYLSPNRRYFSFGGNDRRIYDFESEEEFALPSSENEYRDLFEAWSPSIEHSYLVIASTNKEAGPWLYFEEQPDFLLTIYDVEKRSLVAEYANVTLPYMSPDETKILYQPAKTGSFREAAPCIFDTLSGETKCYNQVLIGHSKAGYQGLSITSLSWSPDGNSIGYIYSQYNNALYPYSLDGGFCMLELETEKESCILQALGELEGIGTRVPERYSWSPDGKYISFLWGILGPNSDDELADGYGIARIDGGEYFFLPYESVNHYDVGLWRPEN